VRGVAFGTSHHCVQLVVFENSVALLSMLHCVQQVEIVGDLRGCCAALYVGRLVGIGTGASTL